MVPSLKFAAVPNRTTQPSSWRFVFSSCQVGSGRQNKNMSFKYADNIPPVLSYFWGAFPNSVSPTCIDLFVTKQFSEQGFGDTIWR
jgi:hypothetical protein